MRYKTGGLQSFDHKINYGASDAYSPRGRTQASRESRSHCLRIKRGQLNSINNGMIRLDQAVHQYNYFHELFDYAPTLIPVPKSHPLLSESLWPSLMISCAMLERDLGSTSEPLLVRTREIPKSSTSKCGQRPRIKQQMSSLACETRGEETRRHFVLVDDVITMGTTLAACTSVLRKHYPNAAIACFALVRTMKSKESEIENIHAPVEGQILVSPYQRVFRSP